MDRIILWDDMLDTIRPFYPNRERGRPPIPLGTMLRICFLQQWFGYSDPAMEDDLYDHRAVRIFAGVDVNTVPDETPLGRFRHRLEQHDLTQELFRIAAQVLMGHGIRIRSGTIVDATILSAPSSTKNQKRQRDPEMKQTQKGTTWHFGMKVPVGTDTQGLVHSKAGWVPKQHPTAACALPPSLGSRPDTLVQGKRWPLLSPRTFIPQRFLSFSPCRN